MFSLHSADHVSDGHVHMHEHDYIEGVVTNKCHIDTIIATSLLEGSLVPGPSQTSVCRLQYPRICTASDKLWGEKAWEFECGYTWKAPFTI